MANDRVFNFSAGPSMLPLEVLQRAGAEITNYGGSGMSVMEMSHRPRCSSRFLTKPRKSSAGSWVCPEGYKVLFLQGGGTMQFGMIPLNLIGKTGKADYAVTGHFANLAMKEAKKYGTVNIAASSEDRKHVYIPHPGPAEGGRGCLLLLLLLQQHHRGHPVAVRPGDRQRTPGLRHVLGHPLPPGGCEQVRPDLRRGPEEPGPRRPDHRHHPGGSGRQRAAHHPPPS